MLLESLSCTDVHAHLRSLCQKQSTGTFFIIDEGHLLERIGLWDGEIVSLFGKNIEGVKSLSAIHCGEEGRDTFTISFTDGAVPSTHMDLPPTAEILAILDGLGPISSVSQSGERPSSLSTDAKAVLEQTLQEFIGPVAAIICDECFSAATDLDNAIDMLASEIPSSQTAVRFREQAGQRLLPLKH